MPNRQEQLTSMLRDLRRSITPSLLVIGEVGSTRLTPEQARYLLTWSLLVMSMGRSS